MQRTLIPFVLLSLACLSFATGCPAENNTNNSNNDDNNPVEDVTPDTTKTDSSKDEAKDTVKDETVTVDESKDVAQDDTKDEAVDEATDEGTTPTSGWTKRTIPCFSGIPYIALHFDAVNGYMGCGEATTGAGLFVTQDKGQTWESARKFSSTRVIDVRRGPDGKLYGAGKDTLDGFRAFEIDDTNPTPNGLKLVGVFRPETTSAFKKVERGQNVVLTADGQMLVDSSLNRTAAYRSSPTAAWDELEYVGEGETSKFITRIRSFDNKFYGVGSTISTIAEVHLPSKTEGSPFFTTVNPLARRSAELQEFHMWSATKMIAVGVNVSDNFPLILIGEGDLYDSANWRQVEIFDSGIEYKGNIRGMAVKGDTIVVVGGKIPTSKGGFMLRSEDAGETWTDITPTTQGKVNRLWNVWMWDNGDLFAAGEQGGWFYKK